MAVLPSGRQAMIGQLSEMPGRDRLRFVDEGMIGTLFDACDRGAVPSVGMAWGIDTIVDDELETSDGVCMEGGDHGSLLRMSGDAFHALMSEARQAISAGRRIAEEPLGPARRRGPSRVAASLRSPGPD